MSNILFFNLFLRLFMESYLELAITSIVNLHLTFWETTSDYIASVGSIVVAVSIAIVPVLLIWAL